MGWEVQSDDKDAKVVVNGANCRDGRERTDILTIDKATGDKRHDFIGTGANDGLTQAHDWQPTRK